MALQSVQHSSYEPHSGKRTWHVYSEGLDLNTGGRSYTLVRAGKKDIAKVQEIYAKSPVPGYSIADVIIINNPILVHQFELSANVLKERESNPAFQASWHKDSDHEWREKVYALFKSMVKSYTDSQYPRLKFLPTWHATREDVADGIYRCGYANLGITDSGFFGNGLYGTPDAEYAYNVYGKKGNGVLILNWMFTFATYPVVYSDSSKLKGRTNYGQYDSHFVPVYPRNPNDPNEVNFDACKPSQSHKYTEFVVFDRGQALPRYIVKLQANIKKQIQIVPNSSTSLFEQGMSCYKKADYPNAFKFFYTSAQQKDYKAQYMVGLCCYQGQGTTVDYPRAIKYFQLSAQQNYHASIFMIGRCLLNGKGVQKDHKKAVVYLQRAQQLGSQEAAEYLKRFDK